LTPAKQALGARNYLAVLMPLWGQTMIALTHELALGHIGHLITHGAS
jgi:hypothetical protein